MPVHSASSRTLAWVSLVPAVTGKSAAGLAFQAHSPAPLAVMLDAVTDRIGEQGRGVRAIRFELIDVIVHKFTRGTPRRPLAPRPEREEQPVRGPSRRRNCREKYCVAPLLSPLTSARLATAPPNRTPAWGFRIIQRDAGLGNRHRRCCKAPA
jgi:hypothetical protein